MDCEFLSHGHEGEYTFHGRCSVPEIWVDSMSLWTLFCRLVLFSFVRSFGLVKWRRCEVEVKRISE